MINAAIDWSRVKALFAGALEEPAGRRDAWLVAQCNGDDAWQPAAWRDARAVGIITARVKLLLKVCDAVQFAHRNLIVHRDLKPSNILVTADAEPKLLDFGIAKPLDGDNDHGLTATRSQPMAREYAAAEQVLGEPITTATNVYAQRCWRKSTRSDCIRTVFCSAPPGRAQDIKGLARARPCLSRWDCAILPT
jgi:hypothetical protein